MGVQTFIMLQKFSLSNESPFELSIKGAICNFSSKMNPFLLPVCEWVLITHYNDPLVRFCYSL